MVGARPEWLEFPAAVRRSFTTADVAAALAMPRPGVVELAALLSPAATPRLEQLAAKAQALTRRHFGRVVSLYAPLYLSNYCSGGCVYCGYAADRQLRRHKLAADQVRQELQALRQLGIEEVLLLTGERTPAVAVDYVVANVELAAAMMPAVAIETFPMGESEYRRLVEAGCTGVTLYQETYDPQSYAAMHRWGPKRDYADRLAAPERALAAGLRMLGVGALLGLAEPVGEMLSLFLHVQHLRRHYWRAGLSVSFPRLRPQAGQFEAPYAVSERWLAQAIFAFRICLPDVPLVLSTRENAGFRDGMAGVGISKMSVASRTTVGGYGQAVAEDSGQFEVGDSRTVETFCASLQGKGLSPVFKNWDAVYR